MPVFSLQSLSDWLCDSALSGNHTVVVVMGSALLGLQLLKDVEAAADARDGTPGVMASEYALKYAVFHLSSALAGGKLDALSLKAALTKWEFLRQVFSGGHGGYTVRALGELLSPSTIYQKLLTASTSEQQTAALHYAKDSLSWLRRFFNDFERNSAEMEVVSLSAPMGTLKVR